MARVERWSVNKFYKKTPQGPKIDSVPSKAEYDFPVAQVLQQDAGGEERWMRGFKDLLLRRSDRAVQHVRFNCPDADEQVGGEGEWRAPRQIDSGKKLDEVARPIALRDIDPETPTCVICTSTYDEADTLPVALNCDAQGRHMLCKQCLRLLCEQLGPANVRCPYCRHELFEDQKTIDSLKFGVEEDEGKTVLADPRFDEYEMLMKANVDLDRELATSQSEVVTLTPATGRVMLAAFDYIIAGCKRQDTRSIPLHM